MTNYPHQPGSPQFDGADAYEAYCDEQERAMGKTRFESCPYCKGSGVVAVRVTVYEHGCGFPHDDTDERPCEKCGGSGWVESDQELVR